MVINGKLLSEFVVSEIQEDLKKATTRGIAPKIAIITLGEEASWKAYVGQKLKLAHRLGIEAELINLESSDEKELIMRIEEINKDHSIHGLIVQRPIPSHFDREKVIHAVAQSKDIDGFRNDSPYEVPVVRAIEHILNYIGSLLKEETFQKWLSKQDFLVIGKGETAGRPVINWLEKKNFKVKIVDSSIIDRKELIKNANIIISAVGKNDIIKADDITQGVILIGIGLYRGSDGKLHGDYNEEAIKHIASFYTPTPGGVGPLNLAYLFKNLVQAALE